MLSHLKLIKASLSRISLHYVRISESYLRKIDSVKGDHRVLFNEQGIPCGLLIFLKFTFMIYICKLWKSYSESPCIMHRSGRYSCVTLNLSFLNRCIKGTNILNVLKMEIHRRSSINHALSQIKFTLEEQIVAHNFGDVQEVLQALRVSDVHYFRNFVRGDYFSHNTFQSFFVKIVLKYIKKITIH